MVVPETGVTREISRGERRERYFGSSALLPSNFPAVLLIAKDAVGQLPQTCRAFCACLVSRARQDEVITLRMESSLPA